VQDHSLQKADKDSHYVTSLRHDLNYFSVIQEQTELLPGSQAC